MTNQNRRRFSEAILERHLSDNEYQLWVRFMQSCGRAFPVSQKLMMKVCRQIALNIFEWLSESHCRSGQRLQNN